MKKKKDKHDVGYGKPPLHSRFQKGQSGNPKGRPPKKESIRCIEDAFIERLSKEILVNGKPMSKMDAFVDTTINDALKGKSSARALIMDILKNRNLSEDVGEDLTAWQEDQKMLADFIANHKPLEEDQP